MGSPQPFGSYPRLIRVQSVAALTWLRLCRAVESALDAGGAALGEGAHLLEGRHGRVARESGQQRAVGPAELERFFGRLACQQAVEKPRRKAVATPHAIVHVQIRSEERRVGKECRL